MLHPYAVEGALSVNIWCSVLVQWSFNFQHLHYWVLITGSVVFILRGQQIKPRLTRWNIWLRDDMMYTKLCMVGTQIMNYFFWDRFIHIIIHMLNIFS